MLYIPNFFEPIRKLMKWEKVAIDNMAFRLHYKVTMLLFLGFVVMVTAKQHFGDPIDCHMDNAASPIQPKVMNSWCWLTGTYTNEFLSQDSLDECLKHHSMYICRLGHFNPRKHRKIHHSYYQWVSWVIFGQAVLFYLPRLLWKICEGGKVKFITSACPTTPAETEADEDTRADRLHAVYKKYVGHNQSYANKFFCCELLNLINVIGQLYLVDRFLGGNFKHYGSNVLQSFLAGKEDDPMGDAFPKVTKCYFDRYATGGSKLDMDNMCILSLNIINDKVYLVMWFWLHLLLALTSLNLVYRVLVLVIPGARSYVLWQGAGKRSGGSWETTVSVATNMPLGDWFLLRQISKNVDELSFVKLIRKIAEAKEGYLDIQANQRFATLKLSPFLRKNKESKMRGEFGLEQWTRANRARKDSYNVLREKENAAYDGSCNSSNPIYPELEASAPTSTDTLDRLEAKVRKEDELRQDTKGMSSNPSTQALINVSD